jgi:hypothetical protein
MNIMIKYNISDDKIIKDINDKILLSPKISKERCFKYLTNRYGIMDRDDFNKCWKNRNKPTK